jgi:hypothetical protein
MFVKAPLNPPSRYCFTTRQTSDACSRGKLDVDVFRAPGEAYGVEGSGQEGVQRPFRPRIIRTAR